MKTEVNNRNQQNQEEMGRIIINIGNAGFMAYGARRHFISTPPLTYWA